MATEASAASLGVAASRYSRRWLAAGVMMVAGAVADMYAEESGDGGEV